VTRRVVAPWLTRPAAAAAPPGIDPGELARAMFEDLYDTLSELDLVEVAALAAAGGLDPVRSVLWPGTPCAEVAAVDAAQALQTLAALHGLDDGSVVMVVSADAPDLPPLLVGKAMRALGTAEVAYCEAAGGGLVLLAVRTPVPAWLTTLGPDLDDPGVVAALRAAAPERRRLAATPGWHRLRAPVDLASLDRGLEGWEVTRALLAGRPLRQVD